MGASDRDLMVAGERRTHLTARRDELGLLVARRGERKIPPVSFFIHGRFSFGFEAAQVKPLVGCSYSTRAPPAASRITMPLEKRMGEIRERRGPSVCRKPHPGKLVTAEMVGRYLSSRRANRLLCYS